jgi:hypothetical protein
MNHHDTARAAINGRDMRQRTPAEIADQLGRDATSLEMTGQSFEKDKAFYQHVAANLREAAEFLASWDDRMKDQARRRAHQFRTGTNNGLTTAVTILSGLRAPMPAAPGPAIAWRNACDAGINALQVLLASEPVLLGDDQ